MSVKPTPYEQQRAEDRRKQSDAEQQTLDAAIAACGPGAIRYGYWVLRDKTGKEPQVRQYCCQQLEHLGWQPALPDDQRFQERLTLGNHKGYDFNGATVFPFRQEKYFGYIEVTKPKTAEQLAEAAVKRLSKELSLVTREQAESLFPEMQEDRINALEAEIKLRKQD